MIGVVVDTNVVVSAALKRHGLEARVLDLVSAGKFVLFITAEIMDEYDVVLRRPRLRISQDSVEKLLDLITRYSVRVQPSRRLNVSPDEDDNRFLECAEIARADYLVTGNQRHFPHSWKRTQVINARRFVEILLEAEHGG